MKICFFGNKQLTREFLEYCVNEGVLIDTLVSISTSEVDADQISGFDSTLVSYARSVGCNIIYFSCDNFFKYYRIYWRNYSRIIARY